MLGNNWGAALHKLGRFEEAIQKYQQANTIQPENALNLNNWGIALEKLGCYKEVKKMYQRAATATRISGDSSSAEKHKRYTNEL